jgi:lipopolysaccharide transport system ATP-binding protein
MYVRLAFAVAAHLEPEILVVDEVLAVGDAAFQEKCLGKMEDVATREGRTVLFVSHQMAAIEKLCQRAFLLERGKLSFIGSQSEAISQYVSTLSTQFASLRERKDRKGSGEVQVVEIEITDESGNALSKVPCGRNTKIHLKFEAKPHFRASGLTVGIVCRNQLNVPLFQLNSIITGKDFGDVLPLKGAFVCWIKSFPLMPSTYNLDYSIMKNGREYIDNLSSSIPIHVIPGDFFGTGKLPNSNLSTFLVSGQWSLESPQASY